MCGAYQGGQCPVTGLIAARERGNLDEVVTYGFEAKHDNGDNVSSALLVANMAKYAINDFWQQ